MKEDQDIAEAFIDGGFRIEQFIWIAGQSERPSERLKEFLTEWPKTAEKLLGISIPEGDEDNDFEETMQALFRLARLGFLIEVAVPVPSSFFKGGYSYSWGFVQHEWTYVDQFNAKEIIAKAEKMKAALHKETKAKLTQGKPA